MQLEIIAKSYTANKDLTFFLVFEMQIFEGASAIVYKHFFPVSCET